MAIKIRRDIETEYDPNKLVQGELAITTDTGKMYFCYSPGNVKQLATATDLQNMLDASDTAYAALIQLIADLETNPSELTNILANISALQSDKLDKTGDSEYNTVTFETATTDADIVSGDTHTTLFGKIKKRFITLASAIGLKADQTALDTKANKTVISDAYSASATYAIGDYCIYSDMLYRCTTAITTAEEWTAAHWTAVTVAAEIGTLNHILDIQSGSWMPTIVGGGTGAITGGETSYYKIGKLVHISAALWFKMTSITGDILTLGNLPLNIGCVRVIFPVGYSSLPNSGGYVLGGIKNTNTIGLQEGGTAAIYPSSNLTVDVEYILQFSGTYQCV